MTAFEVGFIKRAQEYGLTEKQAAGLIESNPDWTPQVEALMNQAADPTRKNIMDQYQYPQMGMHQKPIVNKPLVPDRLFNEAIGKLMPQGAPITQKNIKTQIDYPQMGTLNSSKLVIKGLKN